MTELEVLLEATSRCIRCFLEIVDVGAGQPHQPACQNQTGDKNLPRTYTTQCNGDSNIMDLKSEVTC